MIQKLKLLILNIKSTMCGEKKKQPIKTKCSVKVLVNRVIGEAADWQQTPYEGLVCGPY